MYIFLTQCFPSRIGGIESLVSNLALTIAKNNKVIVLADQHNYILDAIFDQKHKDKILVRRYRGIKFFRQRKKVKELNLITHSQKIECVIADTWKSLELCADNLNEKKIPTICLTHGNELLSKTANKKNRISSTLKKVTSIIANSNYTSNLVKELIGNINKIQIAYPGANDLRLLDSDNSLQVSGDPILLTLSRLEKRKGHIFVLEAVKKLKENFPNIKYIIAGEGEQKNNLMKFVKEHSLSHNVLFTGNVNDQEKKQLFKLTTLMVMPTIDESHNQSIEGFGIVYIEAAFFSIPSVASSVGGASEAILDKKTGIIIDDTEELYDVLYDLLLNQDKLKKLGHNAKDRAQKSFTWDKVVNNYLSSIQQ